MHKDAEDLKYEGLYVIIVGTLVALLFGYMVGGF